MPESQSRVVVIPGDDAAPEAVAAAMHVLRRLELPIDWDVLPAGAELESMAADEREKWVNDRIDAADTVLFGSTNGTTPGVLHMRWDRETYANVRPIRWRPGFQSPLVNPADIDYVIVRENLEDMYVGVMGPLTDLRSAGLAGERSRLPAGREGRYAAKVITRDGTERVSRFACEVAAKRRNKLTVSAKTNMLPATDRWFCDIAREIAQEYAGLEFEQFIVDDMAHRLVSAPHELDVLLLPNLYGDILSDEAAATIGGLGLAPSGCYGNDFAYFESAHGTAPDIAGQHKINPTATLVSGVMMLEHLGLNEQAARLDEAISNVYAEGRVLTPDQGGAASTDEFAAAVVAAL